MKRIAMGFLWFMAFYFALNTLVGALAGALAVAMSPPGAQALGATSAAAAIVQYQLYIFLISLLSALAGTLTRALPGTNRDSAAAVSDQQRPTPSPWGFWATLGFSGIVAAVFVGLGIALAVPFTAAQLAGNPALDYDASMRSLEANGLYMAVVTLATSLVCSSLILLFAALRNRITIGDYLRLKPVPAVFLSRWILTVVLLAGLWDVSNWLLDRELVPQVLVHAYRTAGIIPLFWLAIVVAAPVFEELFFRGFLFAGLSASFVGPKGAIALTSFIWGAIHVQYEIYDILLICVAGVILGIARVKTGSIYAPLLMHSTINLIATVETWLITRTGG